ncbi:ExbD/TolR family protein [Robiginitalea sp. IMCC43444]|uniref:ExbD/TolR family protein n=1 Tax=Robiginitalea sp. IMCC43444 TaxID=3459121 RepID=UPI00404291E7
MKKLRFPIPGHRLFGLFLCLISLPLICGEGLAQQSRPEDKLFDCIRGAYPNAGLSLDSLMLTFEGELIEEGLLETNSASDYRGLLQQIASGQRIIRPVERNFGPRFLQLEKDSLVYLDCRDMQSKLLSVTEESTLYRFAITKNNLLQQQASASVEAANLLEVLADTDFELPYYRLFTYYIIDMSATEVSLELPSLAELQATGGLQSSGANILRIYLNEEQQLVVNDNIYSLEQLKETISTHILQFQKDAVYILEVESDVKYSELTRLKDEIALSITTVRNNYARSRFNKTFLELNPEETALVTRQFPILIVSP